MTRVRLILLSVAAGLSLSGAAIAQPAPSTADVAKQRTFAISAGGFGMHTHDAVPNRYAPSSHSASGYAEHRLTHQSRTAPSIIETSRGRASRAPLHRPFWYLIIMAWIWVADTTICANSIMTGARAESCWPGLEPQ